MWPPPQRLHPSLFVLIAVLAFSACGNDATPKLETPQAPAPADSPYPPTAKVALHEQFLDDMSMERHPADGGGSVQLLLDPGEDGSVLASGWDRWKFEYTAGPEGIAVGGSLLFLVPPFWGWSSPQARSERSPGFSVATTTAEGVELQAMQVDSNLLSVRVTGRSLVEGEIILLTYGASEALAKADQYAESNSAFYFKVDGDGDGLSGLIDQRPAVTVHPRVASRVSACLPSTAQPGAALELRLAFMDGMANHVPRVQGTLTLRSIPAGLELPESVELAASAKGSLSIPFRAPLPGIYRVEVEFKGSSHEHGEQAPLPVEDSIRSNPICVAQDITPVYWGDLHGHSNHSDGTGTPLAYYEYARDISALDFAVLTDHDHFGLRFLDATPEIWQEIRGVVSETHQPHRFLALLGYEWTSWLYGHRHVVYFDGQGEVLSSVGASTTTPQELWDALRGQAALTFAHHSAGGPVATDWSFTSDPILEPVTEVMSVHGSSEASDSPSRIRGGIPGNFVRDQLDRGQLFGFVGSGDSHDGHPGHAHLSPAAGWRKTPPDPKGRRASLRNGNGGLAGVRAQALTPEALLQAFRARSTYATSGPRIWLQTTLSGHPMGSTLEVGSLGKSPTLSVEFAGTSGVEYLELIQRGKAIERFDCEGQLDGQFERKVIDLKPGDYLYLRLLQNDGALAWSSPFFVK